MKSFLFSFSLLVLIGFKTNAQATSDSIVVEKVLMGYKFYYGYEELNMKKLVRIMEKNPEAYTLIKKARANNVVSGVIGGIGGFFVGIALGSAISSGEMSWGTLGIGAGIILVSVPISIKAVRQARGAVHIYNRQYRSVSYWDKTDLRIGLNGNGLGLRLGF